MGWHIFTAEVIHSRPQMGSSSFGVGDADTAGSVDSRLEASQEGGRHRGQETGGGRGRGLSGVIDISCCACLCQLARVQTRREQKMAAYATGGAVLGDRDRRERKSDGLWVV